MSAGHIFDEKGSKSSETSIKSMSKHFNVFYKDEFSIKEDINPALYPTDLTFSTLEPKHVTDSLVGCFLNYLVRAKTFKPTKANQETQLLSFATMSHYASSFKNTLKKRFSSCSCPSSLINDQYKMYTNVMRMKKFKQVNATDKPIFGAYEAASDEDLKAIAAITFWSNQQEDSEFHLLMNTMITNCGRGSEVSFLYND